MTQKNTTTSTKTPKARPARGVKQIREWPEAATPEGFKWALRKHPESDLADSIIPIFAAGSVAETQALGTPEDETQGSKAWADVNAAQVATTNARRAACHERVLRHVANLASNATTATFVEKDLEPKTFEMVTTLLRAGAEIAACLEAYARAAKAS